jgi:Tfp pilus assembly protein PilO
MRQWSILTGVAVVVVFVAGWFMLIKPQKSKVADLKSQATTQNATNQQLLTQISSLQAEQKQLPAQQLALQKFSTEVPDTASEPTLIRQLSAAAQGAGVDLISMTPGTATALASATTGTATTSSSLASPAAGSLTELPVSVGIIGSYANVESFFQSLEKLPRALLVNGWSLCPLAGSTSGSSSTGGASCTLPTVPGNKTPPSGTLGATLSANVFYASAPATTQTAPATTTGATATTPSTAPSTAASTAPTTAATPATTS